MKHLIAIALTLTAWTAGTEAQSTQKLTATKATEYGLIYRLPSTVLDITVEASRTIQKPGEFYKYAKKYLNADNAIATPSEKWNLKSVTVVPRGRADGDEEYLMQFKSGTSPYLIINDAGLPIALNTETIPASIDPKLPKPTEAQPTPLEVPAARQAITEEMLQSQSIAKRAELAAAQIYALRQSRNDLITGQADQMPPDGKAMQLVLDNIAAQEAALTAMFLGTEQVSTDVATFTYTPEEAASNDVVARISSFKGIVDPDDLSGEPIYISIDVTDRGKLPVNEKGETKKYPKGGVA
ncbi:MAG: DUF4831 family protein, partial [Muribaculaceae bacterium]|nr:DUF4831 family protein [Muribaculaceae bacterium]